MRGDYEHTAEGLGQVSGNLIRYPPPTPSCPSSTDPSYHYLTLLSKSKPIRFDCCCSFSLDPPELTSTDGSSCVFLFFLCRTPAPLISSSPPIRPTIKTVTALNRIQSPSANASTALKQRGLASGPSSSSGGGRGQGTTEPLLKVRWARAGASKCRGLSGRRDAGHFRCLN